MRVAYVNGVYAPYDKAEVSAHDRGFLFADAVYEGMRVASGGLVDLDAHLRRLGQSMEGARLPKAMSARALRLIIEEVVRRNRVHEGFVYMQITRGVAERNHIFPDPAPRPGVVIWARSAPAAQGRELDSRGVRVVAMPDLRWKRVDWKTTGLLANVLARQAAKDQGAQEAWLIDASDGTITEGAATNAWIVDAEGQLRTRPAGQDILSGITRARVMDVMRDHQIPFSERAFTLEEAHQAQEAFVSGSSLGLAAVSHIDGARVGGDKDWAGKPGPLARRLRALVEAETQTRAQPPTLAPTLAPILAKSA